MNAPSHLEFTLRDYRVGIASLIKVPPLDKALSVKSD